MDFWTILATGLAHNGTTWGLGALLVSILGIIGRGFASGSIVFQKNIDQMRIDKDAEITRTVAYYDKRVEDAQRTADKFEGAYTNESKARVMQAKTLDELSEYARAADRMLRALPTSQSTPPVVIIKDERGEG